MQNSSYNGIIKLIKCALSGEAEALPQDFLLESAYPLLKMHHTECLAYYGAVVCGIDDSTPVMQKLFSDTCRMSARAERQSFEIDKLEKLLSENEIYYMPIKGTFLRNLYPKPEMRFMSDADMIVKTEQMPIAEKLLCENGFSVEGKSGCEVALIKQGFLVELADTLVADSVGDYHNYFGRGFGEAVQNESDKFRFDMSVENHFVYIFTHFARHYRGGGIGLKHMTDIYMYRKFLKPDEEKTAKEFEKLKLFEFYKNVIKTLEVWFEGAESDNVTDFLTEKIFQSGAYGTKKASLLAEATRRHGDENLKKANRLRLLNSLFAPYKTMCAKYPVLRKIPVLLPVFWIVRAVDVALFKKHKITENLNHFDGLTNEEIREYRDGLDLVGLSFDF